MLVRGVSVVSAELVGDGIGGNGWESRLLLLGLLMVASVYPGGTAVSSSSNVPKLDGPRGAESDGYFVSDREIECAYVASE